MALAAACTLLLAGAARAQTLETPVWPRRHLAVGQVAFLDSWRTAVLGGYLFQGGLHRTRVTTGEFGEDVVVPVQWFVHALGSVGWTFDEDEVAALAQLGVMHRLREDGPLTVSQVGLVGQASLAPRGIGPVGRVDLFHGNAGLSIGWMWFEGQSDGVVVSVELLRCILHDLGLVSRCVF